MTGLGGTSGIFTGSTSGIGLSIAEALAGAAANITINGLADAAEIESHCACLATMGANVRYYGADTFTSDKIVAMVAEAEAA